jgi:hypothetical protein
MNLESSALEPDAAAPGQVRRLGFLGDAEHARVEGARLFFFTRRHRQLDMLDRVDLHRGRCPFMTRARTRG